MSDQNGIQKRLSLFDSTCLIVGVIVGAGIYMLTPDIMRGAKALADTFRFEIPTRVNFSLEGIEVLESIQLGFTPTGMLILFRVGGALLSLMGEMIYTELATSYPREGGDYVYLTRSYGGWTGFLFGWMLTVIVRPGDIAIMAFAFAMYALEICNPLDGTYAQYMESTAALIKIANPLDGRYVLWMGPIYAISAVVLLTATNMIGVRLGKWTQNILTVVKMGGLAAIILAAFLLPAPAPEQITTTPGASFPLPPTAAFLFVLFVFGGWVETAYVAAEVKNVRRTLVRTALLGLGTVAALYIAVNLAFVHVLGYENAMTSGAIASDTIANIAPDWGGRMISALICISALGAINGMTFAGSRISYALGHDHPIFGFLGKWNTTTETPLRALAVQGILTVVLLGLLGSHVDAICYTSPVLYTFFFLSAMSLYVLREKKPDAPSPYRVWGFPFTPFIFGVTCLFLIHGTVTYKPLLTGCAFGIMLLGLPIYWVQCLFTRKS